MQCNDQTMAPRSRHLICAVKLAVNELESRWSNAKMTVACTTHLCLCILNRCTVHRSTAKKNLPYLVFTIKGKYTVQIFRSSSY